MRCRECKELKLSSEFPKQTLCAACTHRPTWCLECLESYIEGARDEDNPQDGEVTCPDCNFPLNDEDCKRLDGKLEGLKVGVLKSLTFNREDDEEVVEGSGTIKVCLLSGAVHIIEVHSRDTSLDVKNNIFRESKIQVERQRLFFRGKEVLQWAAGGGPGQTFGAHGIPFGESLHLMILLYETDSHSAGAVRWLEFQIEWTPRQHGGMRQAVRAYLDAICFVATEDGSPLGSVTYRRQTQRDFPAIQHTGAAMDSCKQTMSVDCDGLPAHASVLVFALAAAPGYKAWVNGRAAHVTLAHFKDPTISLIDQVSRQQFARYSLANAGDRQCFLLAVARRKPGGSGWQVQGAGRPCDGHAYQTDHIESEVRDLIESMAAAHTSTAPGRRLALPAPATGRSSAARTAQGPENGQEAAFEARDAPAADAPVETKKAYFWLQAARSLFIEEDHTMELPILGSIQEVRHAWQLTGLSQTSNMSHIIGQRNDLFTIRKQERNGNLLVSLTRMGRAAANQGSIMDYQLPPTSGDWPSPGKGMPLGVSPSHAPPGFWAGQVVPKGKSAKGQVKGKGKGKEKGKDLRGYMYGQVGKGGKGGKGGGATSFGPPKGGPKGKGGAAAGKGSGNANFDPLAFEDPWANWG